MAYLRTNLSEAVLKQNLSNRDIHEIKDPRYPLRFRYNKSRTGGSWYYVRGKKWLKLGTWPLVKFSVVIYRLPLIEINLASGLEGDAAISEEFTTVSDLLNWYVGRVFDMGTLSPARKATIKTAVNTYLIPRVGAVWLVDVSLNEIDKHIMLKMRRNNYSIATIALAFGIFKKAFKTAAIMKRIDRDPVTGMKFTDFIAEPIQPKPAQIAPHQIPAVLKTISTAKPTERMLAYLMALHGTRIGETTRARWEWFDFDAAVWSIPANVTKNKKAIKIPLSTLTVRLLQEYRQEQRKKGYRGVYVFVTPSHKPLNDRDASKYIRRVSGGAWTAHDLRKAYRDLLGDINIEYLTAELLINHSLTKLDKTYNQSEALERMRAATNKAHDWILARTNHF